MEVGECRPPHPSNDHRRVQMLTSRENQLARDIASEARANESFMDYMTSEELVREMAKEVSFILRGFRPPLSEPIIVRAIELFRDPQFIA